MSVSPEVHYASLDELSLDPLNPRLGRHNMDEKLKQDQILSIISDWSLEELASSFIESKGFWVQEALIVVKEKLYNKETLVVVEGNRRLAALKLLNKAYENKDSVSPKFIEIIKDTTVPKNLFTKIPYLIADKRRDVDAYLGFRHVTGIKQWNPAEKAQFISKLVDEGWSFDGIRKKIGSKTPTVRTHYLTYRILLQIEDSFDQVPLENIEKRFSVLYLTIQKEGAYHYLNIDIFTNDAQKNKFPVPKKHLKNLKNFAVWLFGGKDQEPLFSDSRDATKFSKILENQEAVKYLETSDNPLFDQAIRIAGADEEEIGMLIRNAAYNVEASLSRAHLHRKSKDVQRAYQLLKSHFQQLESIFEKNS